MSDIANMLNSKISSRITTKNEKEQEKKCLTRIINEKTKRNDKIFLKIHQK
jgi:hypothetical protein